ncbi:uncharacterized protein GGS22DRAFT_175130 [Annulohypoxylon maeteangense]|uniref:uncharacterized protein n=1 Tax=Annulohypoxylon maeteangense TaxID=1927788 RepID=UPI0020088D5E|nr:uncharacterized protein GGS22DRAFT_175130 [Annulohypoxylon maeteangense]KAI0880382.1 hypothetical protein GGS22DRAFT_175130 [Annulohypoxylon maeteangense]
MEKTNPPSPAPSNSNTHPSATADEVLRNQFQQLIQHNASTAPVDVDGHIGSNPHSRYSSPAPQQQQMTMPMYDHGSPYSSAPPASAYSSGYQQQSYQMEPSPYPQLPDTGSSMTPHNAYSTPATSPPTPMQSDGMMTRSGRAISRVHGSTPVLGPRPSRVVKRSPKPESEASVKSGAGAKAKKKRRGKGVGGEPAVVLEAPLSVLVKDISTVQDTNIEEYVNRLPEVRQAEVRDSKEGKIKRPMNAFMLYRKAYQNRTKEWKKHDNHQVISQVCGTSWNMESQELRDQYDSWAKIERANHKLAFPDYKFAPAKAKNKKNIVAPSRGATGDSEDDGSDLEGYEWDISAPPSRNASRAARPMYDPDADYRPPGMRTAYPTYHQSPVAHHRGLPYPAHQSSFQYSNPGKPRPSDYGAGLGQNQYYQQTSEFRPSYSHPMAAYGGGALQGQMHSFVENVFMNKANSPAGSFHNPSPVDQYGELMGSAYPPPPQHQVAMPHQRGLSRVNEHQIDPSLMGHQGGAHQYDALGILGLGDHNDGGVHYSLDQGSLSGHAASTTSVMDDGVNHHSQQQFEQAFHQSSNVDAGAETPWHDEPSMHLASLHDVPSKMDSGEWETTLEGTDFDIDGILGTTDSPGG